MGLRDGSAPPELGTSEKAGPRRWVLQGECACARLLWCVTWHRDVLPRLWERGCGQGPGTRGDTREGMRGMCGRAQGKEMREGTRQTKSCAGGQGDTWGHPKPFLEGSRPALVGTPRGRPRWLCRACCGCVGVQGRQRLHKCRASPLRHTRGSPLPFPHGAPPCANTPIFGGRV